MRNLVWILLLGIVLGYSCGDKEPKALNVLMIAVDDLRPVLGCYGSKQIISPNIDQLAGEGVLFANNYCNIPVCGASRASVLTGLRPTRNRFLHYYTRADVEAPESICLGQHFRNNGYYTISNGKVYHDMDDNAESWNENWRAKTNETWRDYHIKENVELDLTGKSAVYESKECHDTTYVDGKLAEKTISDLKRMKNAGKPFFIATGFAKPHLPFNAPEKYWNMYSKEQFKPTRREFWPANAPKQAFHDSGELRFYNKIPKKGFVHDTMSINMQHGYNACVSYVDAQIGKVLNALDELKLADNTIVLLWGDHGYNLGEHGLWCKHCNFNTSLQTPLIIKAPGIRKGSITNAITEFVDIYPTLCDLAGIKIPETLDGSSMVPLLYNPNADWKNYAICKWFDGLTIKTPDYAYTEWRNENDSLISSMLYDHVNDINETINLVGEEVYDDIIKRLSEKMNSNKGHEYFKVSPVTPKH